MPLHYVDPNKERGRWYTVLESFGRSRIGPVSCRAISYSESTRGCTARPVGIIHGSLAGLPSPR